MKLDEQALLTRGRQLLEGLAVHGLGETVAGARAHNSGAGIRTMRRLVKPETRCKLQAIKSRGDLARHGIFSVTTAASSSEASGTEGDGLVAQVRSYPPRGFSGAGVGVGTLRGRGILGVLVSWLLGCRFTVLLCLGVWLFGVLAS